MLTNCSAIQPPGQHATRACAVQGERQRCQKTSRQQAFCSKHKIYVTGGNSQYETLREKMKSWSSLGVSYLCQPWLESSDAWRQQLYSFVRRTEKGKGRVGGRFPLFLMAAKGKNLCSYGSLIIEIAIYIAAQQRPQHESESKQIPFLPERLQLYIPAEWPNSSESIALLHVLSSSRPDFFIFIFSCKGHLYSKTDWEWLFLLSPALIPCKNSLCSPYPFSQSLCSMTRCYHQLFLWSAFY